jgi:hypothetical protein
MPPRTERRPAVMWHRPGTVAANDNTPPIAAAGFVTIYA